jgi:hypothetical protein
LDLSAAASIGSVSREFTHCDNRGLGDMTSPSLYLSGVTSGSGALYADGSPVLSTRYPSTPSTLADVIAVLQHHGLRN